MVRIHADRSNRAAPLVHRLQINQSAGDWQVENNKTRRWPVVAIAATYRYLSEGVRILGEAHSTYDDCNTHERNQM
jgi:hypothetical protein